MSFDVFLVFPIAEVTGRCYFTNCFKQKWLQLNFRNKRGLFRTTIQNNLELAQKIKGDMVKK